MEAWLEYANDDTVDQLWKKNQLICVCVCVYSEDLRRWLITQEVDLFRYRFLLQNSDNVQQFLQSQNLLYMPVMIVWSFCFSMHRLTGHNVSFRSENMIVCCRYMRRLWNPRKSGESILHHCWSSWNNLPLHDS